MGVRLRGSVVLRVSLRARMSLLCMAVGMFVCLAMSFHLLPLDLNTSIASFLRFSTLFSTFFGRCWMRDGRVSWLPLPFAVSTKALSCSYFDVQNGARSRTGVKATCVDTFRRPVPAETKEAGSREERERRVHVREATEPKIKRGWGSDVGDGWQPRET